MAEAMHLLPLMAEAMHLWLVEFPEKKEGKEITNIDHKVTQQTPTT